MSLTSLCLGLPITPMRRPNISINSGSAMAEFLLPVTLNVRRGFQTAVQDEALVREVGPWELVKSTHWPN